MALKYIKIGAHLAVAIMCLKCPFTYAQEKPDESGRLVPSVINLLLDQASDGDVSPPVITLDNGYKNGDTITLQLNSAFIAPTASALDAVDGAVAVNQSSNVDTSVIGNYSVNYSAVDAAGNTAILVLNIVVNDDNRPNAVNSVRQFTFNHSLWDHNFSANAVTGHWVGDMAAASSTVYAWNGQFGQLDYHPLPPTPQLGSVNSDDVWVPESLSFEQLEIDNVIIMPNNFARNGTSVSAAYLQDTFRVVDDTAIRQPDIPFLIYEHWPEAVDHPLSNNQWRDYHQQTKGSYHQWFINYQNALIAQRPSVEFRMIPVGPMIADILTNASLQAADMAWTDLYEDNAPHGTVDTYFLAGLITYQAIFGQPVSNSYSPPAQIDGRIRNDFSALNAFVWQRLNYYNENGVRVWVD